MQVSDEDYLATVVDSNTNINAAIRAKLNAAVLDMIDELIDVARNSKNAQVKTAAARTLLKMASDMGSIEVDPVKDLMSDLANGPRIFGARISVTLSNAQTRDACYCRSG